jgi:glutamine amidotransferase
MTVAVIDYGSGNLRSAAKALERAATEGGERILVSADAAIVARADRLVLPGQGDFADCRAGLLAVPGMVEALHEAAIDRGRPLLGICVGMQLMAEWGHERGRHAGLGWIAGEVKRLHPADPRFKLPHMGWNEVDIDMPDHPLFAGLAGGSQFYFAHSYAFQPARGQDRLATTDHGGRFAAAVARGNLAGVQFHPEKSQRVGLRLLANFLAWRP